MPVTNMSMFSPYSVEAQDIERRRRIAEALQMQGMQPIEQQPTPAGGFAVPISPLQGFAKIAQSLMGGYGQRRGMDEMKALGERYAKDRSTAVMQALAAGAGTPEQPEIPMPPDEIGGGPGRPAQAAVAPDRTKVYQSLATSTFPDLQGIGIAEMLRYRAPLKIDAGDRFELRDPQTYAIIGSIAKSATPDARLRAGTALETHATPSGSTLATIEGSAQRHAAPSGSAILANQGAMQRHATPSGSAQLGATTAMRGQDIGANTAIRGQDIGAATTRRGQDIGVDPAIQGPLAEARAAGTATGKATAETAFVLPQAVAAAKQSIDVVDQMIGGLQVDKNGRMTLPAGAPRPHPGFSVGVGASVQPGMQFVPGTDKAGFYALKDQVLGGAFMEAYKTLKGGGQITEIEGQKATAAMTRMNTAQSEVEFVKAAREFQNAIRGAVARATSQAAGAPKRRATDQPARPSVDDLLRKYGG